MFHIYFFITVGVRFKIQIHVPNSLRVFQSFSRLRVELFENITSKYYKNNVLFSIGENRTWCQGTLFVSFLYCKSYQAQAVLELMLLIMVPSHTRIFLRVLTDCTNRKSIVKVLEFKSGLRVITSNY